MQSVIISLNVVNIKNNMVVFEDSRKVTEAKEVLFLDSRRDIFVEEVQNMIQSFKQSSSYEPSKKKIFSKEIKYDYWVKIDSVEEPLQETPGKESTTFKKFVRKHTDPPKGLPWINLRNIGWSNVD